MTRRTRILCAFAATLLPLVAFGEHTRFWRQSDYSDFQRGTPTGIAIRSDGKIAPAPRFDSFADPALAYLWVLRLDAQGRLYAAGGSDAKVLRFDAAGKPTTVFESSELVAQAIAFDAKGNLYVATSPDGKVYKVASDGTKSVFFEPKTKYIWSLAFDQQGTLFVGTGDKGEIFAVAPDGNGKVFYQSNERHARSLLFDSKGNLLIGTEPDGRILRVPITRKNATSAPEAGSPFVLYETDRKEITSLLQDSSGNVYAASIGEKTRTPNLPAILPTPQPAAPAAGGQAANPAAAAGGNAPAAQPGIPASFLGQAATGAEVVKIAPDDSPQVLWTSRDQIVLSMALSGNGKLLMGTGNRGEVVRLEGGGIYSSLEKTAAMQVTSLVSAPDGKVYVATANPGKIFSMGPGLQPDASFVSSPYDASIFSHWGRITWFGENATAAGRVEFYARSGNTSNPEENWSNWTGPYKAAAGETLQCPPARFIQWKAVFINPDSNADASVSWVNLAFQPKNVAPSIDDIAIQEPGVRLTGFGSQAFQANAQAGVMPPAQLRVPQRAGAAPGQSPESDGPGRGGRPEPSPQIGQDHGYQSVYWTAHDDNEDTLVYSIYYRGEGETNWRLLKDKLGDRFYSWDTSTMPDGAYYLKIVASDSPSNPPADALSAERQSDRFEVGNTPPRVEDLRAVVSAQSATVSFAATSTSGAISRALYSFDSGDWQVVFPTGQLTDAPRETYKWDLSGLSAGEHTVSVRIADRFANEAAAKTTFTVSAGR